MSDRVEKAGRVVVCLPEEGYRGTTSTGRPLVVRATGAQTAGRIGVVDIEEEPRLEATIHAHDSDEAWYILAGEYRLYAGGQWYRAPVGTFIFVPGGTPHGFAVLPGTMARKLAFSLPGGPEQAYIETDPDVRSALIPTPIETIALPQSQR